MPFYDLSCENCDTEFTARATMAEKTERRIECPECGSTDVATVYKAAPAYIKSAGDAECAHGGGSACASCPMAG